MKDSLPFVHRTSFAVIKKSKTKSEKRAKHDVGRTSGSNMDGKSDSGEKKNERFTAVSTASTEAHHWKLMAASILQA